MMDQTRRKAPGLNGCVLTLRRTEGSASDATFLHDVRNEEETRAASLHQEPIPFSDHLAWFQRVLASDRTIVLIAEERAVPIGYLRLDRTDGQENVMTLSIALAPAWRGQGLGTTILHAAAAWLEEHFPGTILEAVVLQSNPRSARVFLQAGYRNIATTTMQGHEVDIYRYEHRGPNFTDTFLVGGRAIGRTHSCFLIAEAGSNHDGKLDQALRLIDVAATCHADAVKFQLFRAKNLYPRDAGQADYLAGRTDIYSLTQSMELPETWLPRLAQHSHEQGLLFLVTPFYPEAVATLLPFVPAFKMSSYELTHVPLLEAVAATGLPVFASTGASNLVDIDTAIARYRSAGLRELVLLHCTAAYPAPLLQANLRSITFLHQRYQVLTGLSDHTADPLLAPVIARTLGACVLEKHFTLDRTLPGPDHSFALEPQQLELMVKAVRETEQALGLEDKQVEQCERELHHFARPALFASRELAVGDVFDQSAIQVLRRGATKASLDATYLDRLLGRKARKAYHPGEPVALDELA